jgi:DNA-directed RNA polymerase specialized sigma24 family protein
MAPKRAGRTATPPASLATADWDDVFPRVRLWAHRFHRRYLSQIRAAPSPDDLVQEAIAKLYTGRRRLPDHVPLLTVLINNIQSDIWNFLTREGYTKTDSKGKGRQGWGRHVGLEDWMADRDAESLPAASDRRRLHEALRRRFADDPLVRRIVDLLFDDPLLKPRDLAEMLHTSVFEINNAQKRLKRGVQDLYYAR